MDRKQFEKMATKLTLRILCTYNTTLELDPHLFFPFDKDKTAYRMDMVEFCLVEAFYFCHRQRNGRLDLDNLGCSRNHFRHDNSIHL